MFDGLSLLKGWEPFPSAFFNVCAACFFFAVLLPDLKLVIKAKKNYFMPMRFFFCLFVASFILFVHAILGFYGVWKGAAETKDAANIAKLVMIGCFITVNFFGTVANLYQIKVKLDNCKKAKEIGVSEADYWEYHIKPTLPPENQNL